MSVASTVKDAWRWFLKELVRAIFLPTLKFLGPALLPFIVLAFRHGRAFVVSEHAVKGWIILLVGGLFLALLVLQLRERQTIKRLTPPSERTFRMLGFVFVLTQDFWLNCGQLLVAETSSGHLARMVLGPFCATCQHDVSNLITDVRLLQLCPHCRAPFQLNALRPVLAPERLDELRRTVYGRAQADVRRGILR